MFCSPSIKSDKEEFTQHTHMSRLIPEMFRSHCVSVQAPLFSNKRPPLPSVVTVTATRSSRNHVFFLRKDVFVLILFNQILWAFYAPAILLDRLPKHRLQRSANIANRQLFQPKLSRLKWFPWPHGIVTKNTKRFSIASIYFRVSFSD